MYLCPWNILKIDICLFRLLNPVVVCGPTTLGKSTCSCKKCRYSDMAGFTSALQTNLGGARAVLRYIPAQHRVIAIARKHPSFPTGFSVCLEVGIRLCRQIELDDADVIALRAACMTNFMYNNCLNKMKKWTNSQTKQDD